MKKSATILVSTLLVMSFFGALFFENDASDFESQTDALEKENLTCKDFSNNKMRQ